MVHEILAPATYFPPSPILDTVVKMQRTELGKELLEFGERCALDVITELFEHPKIQATLLYCICQWGLDPRANGMGYLIPLYLDRVGMSKHYCSGGSHRLAAALGREIIEAGGVILSPAEVNKILVSNGQVKGIVMTDGREVHAKVVLSSLDPHLTFVKMVGEEHLVDKDFKAAVKGWQLEKKSLFSVYAVLHEAPRYRANDPWVNEAFETIMGFENVDDLLRYWDGVQAGDIGDKIVGHSTCETMWDSDLARVPPRVITPVTLDVSALRPRAQHIAFFQMHAPYDLKGGWEARTQEIKDKVLERWRHYAPNLTADKVERVSTETPVSIEQRLHSMRRGSIKHGDYSPLQMGVSRPNQYCSTSRTPIGGLYTCGASNYPGGLVIGGCGYLAANAVAQDLGIKKWWSPTALMRRYEKIYLSEK